MNKLPQSPPPDWRQYVLRAMIWVAFVGSLGYAAANGGLDFLENDVSLKLEANRDTVKLASSVPTVIEVKVKLQNSTSQAVQLSALSACKIFRWQVFNRAAELMQSAIPDNKCPETPVSAALGASQKIEEIYTIPLAPERYTAGEDYLVHVWYWGYEAEFQFKAE